MGGLIKVGITGQAGFVGSHLYNFLGTKNDTIVRIDFERNYFEDEVALNNFVTSCDVIVHIAAMNRHENEQVIYDTNVGLVKKLIKACETSNAKPKIIFSSSSQEERNNLYGQSKRDGRVLFETWATKNNAQITSLIIPNVFGPFGKPFYNSFVATFCQQIMHGEEPTVINDSVVNLIYVNQLSDFFYQEILNQETATVKSFAVPASASRKVSEILELLKAYKALYVEQGQVPELNLNSFELDLFNTFTSFLPKDYFPRKFTKHSDLRGAFVEIMRAGSAGQSSFSTTVPGITRGDHYHTRKVERFAVISGKASIKLRKINTDKVYEYILDGNEPAYVDMPVWYTHNITNIGDSDLITIFWINEPFNPEDADTYFVKV